MSGLIAGAIRAYGSGGLRLLGSRCLTFIRRRYYRARARLDGVGVVVEPIDAPRILAAGTIRICRVRVTNTGRCSLGAAPHTRALAIAPLVIGSDGSVFEGQRHHLPRTLRPGEACIIDVCVEAPELRGACRLRFDIVKELSYWFSEIGVKPLEVPVTIEPFPLVLRLVDPPSEVIAGCMYKVKVKLENTGSRPFNPSDRSNPPYLMAAFFLRDGCVVTEGPQRSLPPDIPPGSSFEVETVYEVLQLPGRYQVRIDLTQVGSRWLSGYEFKCLVGDIEVMPHSDLLFASRLPAIELTVDLTNKCPLRCIQCRKTYHEDQDQQRDMDFELFKSLVSQVAPLAHSAMLSSAGEPLMARNFFEALEFIVNSGVHDVAFTTSGLHLNARRAERVMDLGVSRVEFSIDGATAETYNRIRVGSSFDRVIRNVEYLGSLKKGGNGFPILRFNFVLMKSNIHELPDFVDLAARLGVEEVLCQHMIVFDERVKAEALVYEKELANRFVALARKRAERARIRFYHPPFLETEKGESSQAGPSLPSAAAEAVRSNAPPVAPPDANGGIWSQTGSLAYERKTHSAICDGLQICTDPWRKFNVDWQGFVYPCCVWKEEPLGDLNKSTFGEIWESERYRALRQGLASGRLGRSCAECSVITGGDVNTERAFIF